MRPIGTLFAVLAAVAGFLLSPLWAAPRPSHRYRQGRIEKVRVEENGAVRDLGANDDSPAQGTRYVVVVSRSGKKYSGEFYVQDKSDYPISLRRGQKIRFRTFQQQMFACDVHTMMTLVTSTYLELRDPQGKDWDLFMSSNLPPNFNADLRQGSTLEGASQH